MSGNKLPSICFVAHNAYGAITGGRNGHIGGVERQTSLMAKWLAARGWRVSMLTWDEGGPPEEWVDGVRVIKICPNDAGLRGLRFFHPRWTALARAMRKADAALYYHNGAECVTGQVAMWCQQNDRAFVFSTAADPDCDRHHPALKGLRMRLLYQYGIHATSQIIVQTRTQNTLLRRSFGLDSVILPMPCSLPANSLVSRTDLFFREPRLIAWIGRIAPVKRLEWMLDLAEQLRDCKFEVVGPWSDDQYCRGLKPRSEGLPNITLRGALEPRQMHRVYSNASLLCCTSRSEGFPNTFIEAWSHGLPVVTSFDPDGLVAELGLGLSASDVPGLVLAIRRLLDSPALWRHASKQARDYYLANHAIDNAMPRFEQALLRASRRRR